MTDMPPSVPPTSYTPPPPPPPAGGSFTPPPGGPAPAGDRSLMVVLSYLWILGLIPLLTKKDDPEVQWHAKNGLAFLVAEVVIWIAMTVLSFILGRILTALSCGVSMINCVIWIAFLVIRIMCIVKGVGGGRFRIPVVSDYADRTW